MEDSHVPTGTLLLGCRTRTFTLREPDGCLGHTSFFSLRCYFLVWSLSLTAKAFLKCLVPFVRVGARNGGLVVSAWGLFSRVLVSPCQDFQSLSCWGRSPWSGLLATGAQRPGLGSWPEGPEAGAHRTTKSLQHALSVSFLMRLTRFPYICCEVKFIFV